MDREALIRTIRSLSLPPDEFVVFGSGPMGIRNIRECNDIDLVMLRPLLDTLRDRGWIWRQHNGKFIYGPCEAHYGWIFEGYRAEPEALIRNADIFEGVRFARLCDVVTWKLAFKREKDLHDIQLIGAYAREIVHALV